MKKFRLEMCESQVGIGDRQVTARIMSRLTMAKVVEKLGYDNSHLIFYMEPIHRDIYYSIDDVINDITDFLDIVSADYEYDEDTLQLTLRFPPGINFTNLEDAFYYGWEESVFDGEYEDHVFGPYKVVEYPNENEILFHLKDYDGYPLMFFKTYYEVVKGEIIQ